MSGLKNINLVRYAGVYLAMTLAIAFVSYRSTGSIVRAVCVGAFASFVAVFFLMRLDRKSASRLERFRLPDGNYPARISAMGIAHGSCEEVIGACREAIQGLPNFGALKGYEPGKVVMAKTSCSVMSWGEKITVTAYSIQGGTQLHIKSVPRLWTVTEDMRCNFQNVALILRKIHRDFPISDLEPAEYFADVLE